MRGKRRGRRTIWLMVVGLVIGSGPVRAGRTPEIVSPGRAAGSAETVSCPTFSWGRLDTAETWELVVYRVRDVDAAAPPLLSKELPGSVTSWTPDRADCLERGVPLAWSIRARTGDDSSSWAAPRFFEVGPGPMEEELAAALEVIREHLGRDPRPAVSDDVSRIEPGPSGSDEIAGDATSSLPRPVVQPHGRPTAKLTVRGEVRTVDSSGEARLWGRGRPGVILYAKPITGDYCVNFDAGGVEYGLTNILVDWGSAAEACPVGTWVCRQADLVACNTARPDDPEADAVAFDYEANDCYGPVANWPETGHFGWTADAASSAQELWGLGGVFTEAGAALFRATCRNLPVWCCW